MIECVPVLRTEVENVAWPAASTIPVPRAVAPSKKSTAPVGVPGEVLVTVAVKVIVCPAVAGFAEDVTVVIVGAELIVCVSVADVLPAKVALPAYVAVIE